MLDDGGLIMFRILYVIMLFLITETSVAGVLHTDVFGNIYDGDSPFQIGKVNLSGGEGRLYVDEFGYLYVEGSPFSIGKFSSVSGKGFLHADEFGRIRAGDSPFDIDENEARSVLNLQ